MEIRKIREGEKEEALNLMARSFPKSYSSIFFLFPESTFVAVDNGKIVGGINIDVYQAKVQVGYLGWLYVDEKYRGLKIGQSLLDYAIEHLDSSVDIICGCIEGDNPSSFKNLANRPGFSIMPLYKQFKVFGIHIFKVWKRASRFFDMGYFLWHKEAGKDTAPNSLSPTIGKQTVSFLLTVLFNTLLFSLLLLRKGRLTISSIAIPFIVLSLRTTIQAIVFKIRKTKPIYLAWDTAWLSSLISVLLPFYFTTPGGVYPEGKDWNMKEMEKTLSIVGYAAVFSELLLLPLCLWSKDVLTFILLLLVSDSLLCFYPFCGFSASRINRSMHKTLKVLYIAFFTSVSLIVFLFYWC